MSSRLTGDWNKAIAFFSKLSNMDKLLFKVLESDTGKFIETKLKDSITSQSLGLAPLSQTTIRQKNGEKVLIDTSEYVSKLKIVDVKISGDKVTILVGASSSDRHSSGLTMSELANLIENGTANQPPRPHFRLTWDKIKSEVEKNVKESIEKILRSNL